MWLEINEGKVEVHGIEDADKIVNLPKDISGDLADYALHLTDLEIALSSLNAINKVVTLGEAKIQESLWRSAIIHFIKCFSNQVSRGKLDPELVFKDEPPEALEAFRYFKNMRNKNIVHDENAYLQCLNGIVLNKGNKHYKVERIICTSFMAATLEDGTFSNLLLLVNRSIEHVKEYHEKLCGLITEILEVKEYSELTSYGSVIYNLPDVKKIHKPR
ncbi:hypothetical protein [Erwinia sp. CGal63]|uniref:hypothetical protein n=1 Tax=Erwinia sp. CGal63 TaxID=2919889 RepID=UPI0030090188